jgi:hypothetical protein
MKINIQNKGKTESYNLIKSWDDLTLDKWMQLINVSENKNSKDTIDTIALFSDIPKQLIKQLPITIVADLLKIITNKEQKVTALLNKVITVDNVEYGFHPNLEKITIGEYADLEHYIEQGIEKNMPNIMSILFRKITEKEGNVYSIEKYGITDTRVRAEIFRKKMLAKDVNGALVFFWNLGRVLSQILPSYLMINLEKMMNKLKNSNLLKNGDGIALSTI